MEKEEIIKGFLSDEWKTTHQIAKESGMNWYTIFAYLMRATKGVEKLEVKSRIYWKTKNEETNREDNSGLSESV